MLRRVVFTAAAIVLMVAAFQVWDDPGHRGSAAPVGAVYAGTGAESLRGSAFDVALPWGALRVEVSKPRREIGADAEAAGAAGAGSSTSARPSNVRSPDGGSFIGIRVATNVASASPLVTVTRARRVSAPEFALVFANKTHVVPGLVEIDESGGAVRETRTRFVALPDDGKHLVLRVTYEGRSQFIDVWTGRPIAPSPFDLLNAIPADYPVRSCSSPRAWPERYTPVVGNDSCMVRWAGVVPYVDGLGWAPTGKAWLVVTTATQPPTEFVRNGRRGATTLRAVGRVGADGVRLYDGDTRLVRVAYQRYSELRDVEPGAAVDPTQSVFIVDAKPTRLRIEVERYAVATGQARGAPLAEDPAVAVVWDVNLQNDPAWTSFLGVVGREPNTLTANAVMALAPELLAPAAKLPEVGIGADTSPQDAPRMDSTSVPTPSAEASPSAD